MIALEKWYILTPLQKLPKNVKDLGQLNVAKVFKSCPKCKKSPNLVALDMANKNWSMQLYADCRYFGNALLVK